MLETEVHRFLVVKGRNGQVYAIIALLDEQNCSVVIHQDRASVLKYLHNDEMVIDDDCRKKFISLMEASSLPLISPDSVQTIEIYFYAARCLAHAIDRHLKRHSILVNPFRYYPEVLEAPIYKFITMLASYEKFSIQADPEYEMFFNSLWAYKDGSGNIIIQCLYSLPQWEAALLDTENLSEGDLLEIAEQLNDALLASSSVYDSVTIYGDLAHYLYQLLTYDIYTFELLNKCRGCLQGINLTEEEVSFN